MQEKIYPKRTRVYQNDTLNSTHWDHVNFRDDDIVVCTALKTGTTWMLRILSLLVHQNTAVDSEVMKTPWPDYRMWDIEQEVKEMDAIEHRRFIKTHIPLDGLPYNENVKYINVTREMHDAFFSLQNHWSILTDGNLASKDKYGDKPFPRFEDGGDVHQRWKDWLTKSGGFKWEQDGYPFWSMFSYVESFWPYRKLPNILMVHFTDMLNDLEGQMRRVAAFVGIEVPEEKWPELVNAATFDSMKKDLKTLQPKFDKMFKGGGDAFMDKVDGIWKEILTTDEDTKNYESRMGQLDSELREFIEKGSLELGYYPDGKN